MNETFINHVLVYKICLIKMFRSMKIKKGNRNCDSIVIFKLRYHKIVQTFLLDRVVQSK